MAVAAQSEPAGEKFKVSDSAPLQNYILRPYDLLAFTVFQEPELNTQIRVEADGTAVLPLVNKVALGGMTLLEAQRFLVEAYDRDFLVNPQITLQILEYSPRKVQVMGQVNTPGPVMIPIDRELNLIEALALANGLTRLANTRKVVVRRVAEDGTTKTFDLDAQQMMTDDRSQDFILIDGDIIFVPERTI